MLSDGILKTRYTVLLRTYYVQWQITLCNIGSVAHGAAYFGSNSYVPVIIGSVHCSGAEFQLQFCNLSQTPGSSCNHSRNAGVTCVGKWLVHVYRS